MIKRPPFHIAAAASILPWAARSEDPNTKTAALVLDKNNRPIAIGYNGLKSGQEIDNLKIKDRDDKLNYFIHAEINCLSLIKRGEGKTLVTVYSPCVACSHAIIAHEIEKVFYIKKYHRCSNFEKIFDKYGIECNKLLESDIWEALNEGSKLLE